jgi:hypothetical protein
LRHRDAVVISGSEFAESLRVLGPDLHGSDGASVVFDVKVGPGEQYGSGALVERSLG